MDFWGIHWGDDRLTEAEMVEQAMLSDVAAEVDEALLDEAGEEVDEFDFLPEEEDDSFDPSDGPEQVNEDGVNEDGDDSDEGNDDDPLNDPDFLLNPRRTDFENRFA